MISHLSILNYSNSIIIYTFLFQIYTHVLDAINVTQNTNLFISTRKSIVGSCDLNVILQIVYTEVHANII